MTEPAPLAARTIAVETATDPTERVKRVLIVIHGIRDRGGWAAYFKEAMDESGYDMVVAPVVYPRYSSLPFLWGRGAASRPAGDAPRISSGESRNHAYQTAAQTSPTTANT